MSEAIVSRGNGLYGGPPIDRCPYCQLVGRGNVALIPVMSGPDEVTWLCRNWKVCLFPHVYGDEAIRRSIVPRRSVDPSLLGYIALTDGNHLGGQRRILNVMEEDNSMPLSDLAPMPSPPSGHQQRPASIISHSTTSSEGSYHDVTHLMGLSSASVMAPLPTPQAIFSELNYFTLSPPPQVMATSAPTPILDPLPIHDLIEEPVPSAEPPISAPIPMLMAAPQPKPATQTASYASIAFCRKKRIIPANSATVTPSAAPSTAAASKSRKRPLTTKAGEKQSVFPGYGSNNDAGPSSSISSTSNSTTAAVMTMVAKQLAKVRKVL